MNKCCEFELAITGWKPGCISHNLQCKIEHCPEPVVLHVEAAFKVWNSSVLGDDLLWGLIIVHINLFASERPDKSNTVTNKRYFLLSNNY